MRVAGLERVQREVGGVGLQLSRVGGRVDRLAGALRPLAPVPRIAIDLTRGTELRHHRRATGQRRRRRIELVEEPRTDARRDRDRAVLRVGVVRAEARIGEAVRDAVRVVDIEEPVRDDARPLQEVDHHPVERVVAWDRRAANAQRRRRRITTLTVRRCEGFATDRAQVRDRRTAGRIHADVRRVAGGQRDRGLPTSEAERDVAVARGQLGRIALHEEVREQRQRDIAEQAFRRAVLRGVHADEVVVAAVPEAIQEGDRASGAVVLNCAARDAVVPRRDDPRQEADGRVVDVRADAASTTLLHHRLVAIDEVGTTERRQRQEAVALVRLEHDLLRIDAHVRGRVCECVVRSRTRVDLRRRGARAQVAHVVVLERGHEARIGERRQCAEVADAGFWATLAVPEAQRDLVELVELDRGSGVWGPIHLLDVEVEVERIRARQAEVDFAPNGLQTAAVRVEGVLQTLPERGGRRVARDLLLTCSLFRAPAKHRSLRVHRCLVEVVSDATETRGRAAFEAAIDARERTEHVRQRRRASVRHSAVALDFFRQVVGRVWVLVRVRHRAHDGHRKVVLELRTARGGARIQRERNHEAARAVGIVGLQVDRVAREVADALVTGDHVQVVRTRSVLPHRLVEEEALQRLQAQRGLRAVLVERARANQVRSAELGEVERRRRHADASGRTRRIRDAPRTRRDELVDLHLVNEVAGREVERVGRLHRALEVHRLREADHCTRERRDVLVGLTRRAIELRQRRWREQTEVAGIIASAQHGARVGVDATTLVLGHEQRARRVVAQPSIQLSRILREVRAVARIEGFQARNEADQHVDVLDGRLPSVILWVRDDLGHAKRNRVAFDQEAEHVPAVNLVRDARLVDANAHRARADPVDAFQVGRQFADEARRLGIEHKAAREVGARIAAVARTEVADDRRTARVVDARVAIGTQARDCERTFESQRHANVCADVVRRRRQTSRVVARLVLEALAAQQHWVEQQAALLDDDANRQRHEVARLRWVTSDLQELDRFRVAQARHLAVGIADDEEVVRDSDRSREVEAHRSIAGNHRVGLPRPALAHEQRRDQRDIAIQVAEQLIERGRTDFSRNEHARLQRVGIGAEEVVANLGVCLALRCRARDALIPDLATDQHILLEQLDTLPIARRADAVDVRQPAVFDGADLIRGTRRADASVPGRAPTAAAAASRDESEQNETGGTECCTGLGQAGRVACHSVHGNGVLGATVGTVAVVC